jgi:EpsI family protein
MSTADHPVLDDAVTFSRSLHGEQTGGKDLWLYIGLAGFALVLLGAPVFTALWDLWMTREDYSHGFLVPLISLYLIRLRWEAIRTLPIRPAFVSGLGLLLPSLAGLLVGDAGGVITVSSVSFIGLLAGLTLLLFGYRFLQLLAFPLAYLIFMTPFLDVVVDPLHHPLQLMGATVVSTLFRNAGVPTYLDGTFIHFPNGVLEVAVQCSGAGFLISALAIGVPLAALVLHSWWSRSALILIALLVSIVANWMRITLIGMIGYVSGWGPQVHGPLHILQGMLVYWVGLGVLFTAAWILVKVERQRINPVRRSAVGGALSESAESVRRKSGPAWPQWRRPWWVALAMLAGTTLYLYGYDRGPVEAKQSFDSLPSTIGQWVARETEQATPVVKIQGADHELMRVYRRADGTTVRLYVAYLSSQVQGRELVSYLTAPLHQDAAAATISFGQETLPVNIGFSVAYRIKTPILFWYAVNGKTISDRYEAKAASIAQALMRRGSPGALVLIAGDPNDHHVRAVACLKQFAHDLIPILRPYLP